MKLKILLVCREVPYPPDAGYKIRTFNLFRHLSRHHDVQLLSFGQEQADTAAYSGIRDVCSSVNTVTMMRRSKIAQLPLVAKNLFRARPLSIKYASTAEMAAAVSRAIRDDKVDIVHFDDQYIAGNLFPHRNTGAKMSVTFHDVDSDKFRRFFRIESQPGRKLQLLACLAWLRSWEKRVIAWADMSIVMSRRDRELLGGSSATKVVVVPNGVDSALYQPLSAPVASDCVAFFGAMDYAPNHDGALYFLDRIWPIIKDTKPDARLLIVGRNPHESLRKHALPPGIDVTGNVKDVLPYYRDSSVVVVPLRAGGGTRLKILEAMALGRPVVSTSIGAEGLDVTTGEHLLIGDSPEAFAAKVLALFADPALSSRLVATARSFVESTHDWKSLADRLSRFYQGLCDGDEGLFENVGEETVLYG